MEPVFTSEFADLEAVLRAETELRKRRHLWRELREVETAQGPEIIRDGQRVVNFSSNDYLGLANEPFLRDAFKEAVQQFGVGAGASRLISGHLTPHRKLEERLAACKQTEAAVAYGCGYAAAVGAIPAMVGKDDVLFLDKLSHACLVDGARLSEATLRVFPHNNLDRLEAQLAWARKKFPRARLLIVTESVFSMDGDLAPLAELVELKERFGAWLLVDEAHALGVLGPQGRGLIAELGLSHRVELQMGTLGKALGVAGGFLAGNRTLIEWLINHSRSLIFSTAPPPAQAAAASAALDWLASPAGTARQNDLRKNRELLARLCPSLLPQTPPSAIVPIHVGLENAALELAERFLDQGVFIPAVRYPTVPKGQARLRLCLTATHQPHHLTAVAEILRASRDRDRGLP
jgi:glycine C-acetyltransferase/8-amino-7-oxononanoate synthase